MSGHNPPVHYVLQMGKSPYTSCGHRATCLVCTVVLVRVTCEDCLDSDTYKDDVAQAMEHALHPTAKPVLGFDPEVFFDPSIKSPIFKNSTPIFTSNSSTKPQAYCPARIPPAATIHRPTQYSFTILAPGMKVKVP